MHFFNNALVYKNYGHWSRFFHPSICIQPCAASGCTVFLVATHFLNNICKQCFLSNLRVANVTEWAQQTQQEGFIDGLWWMADRTYCSHYWPFFKAKVGHIPFYKHAHCTLWKQKRKSTGIHGFIMTDRERVFNSGYLAHRILQAWNSIHSIRTSLRVVF